MFDGGSIAVDLCDGIGTWGIPSVDGPTSVQGMYRLCSGFFVCSGSELLMVTGLFLQQNFWDAVQLNATEPDIPQSTIFSGWAHADANVSFVNWVNHWHLLATTDPALVQVRNLRVGTSLI
jgi:hypothetical protein